MGRPGSRAARAEWVPRESQAGKGGMDRRGDRAIMADLQSGRGQLDKLAHGERMARQGRPVGMAALAERERMGRREATVPMRGE